MVDVVLPGMNHMTWVLARDPYGCLLQFCIKHSGEKQSEALPMCAFEKDSSARSSGQTQGDSIKLFPKTAESFVEQGLNLNGCDPS